MSEENVPEVNRTPDVEESPRAVEAAAEELSVAEPVAETPAVAEPVADAPAAEETKVETAVEPVAVPAPEAAAEEPAAAEP